MTNLKLGITQEFDCNYLDDHKERLLVVIDDLSQQSAAYDFLMFQGFRRSGEQVYKPHCVNCNACQSLRLPVNHFQPSKSQKRLLNKNKHFSIKISTDEKPTYYPLFEKYINTLHSDGTMYPATKAQFDGFIFTKVTDQLFIEVYDGEKLISVAVTDAMPIALSAVYTFYDPEYRANGLGIYSILQQIKHTQSLGKEYLYLGYQIDECQKMNYKNKFYPHERLIENRWQTINK